MAPDDGQVDLKRVLKSCLTAIADQGGELLRRRQADLIVGADDLSIRVDGEELRPAHIILAAGTATPLLARKVGLELHMRSRPGLLVRLIGVELDLPGVVHLPGAGPARLAVRNDSSGGILLEEIGSDGVDPSAEHAERLAHRARSHLPALAHAKVDRVGLEWRPCPADGLPVIGAVPGASNVHVAMCPKGATAAPAIGRLFARELATGEMSPILRPFSAARFDEQALQVSIDVEGVFAPE